MPSCKPIPLNASLGLRPSHQTYQGFPRCSYAICHGRSDMRSSSSCWLHSKGVNAPGISILLAKNMIGTGLAQMSWCFKSISSSSFATHILILAQFCHEKFQSTRITYQWSQRQKLWPQLEHNSVPKVIYSVTDQTCQSK